MRCVIFSTFILFFAATSMLQSSEATCEAAAKDQFASLTLRMLTDGKPNPAVTAGDAAWERLRLRCARGEAGSAEAATDALAIIQARKALEAAASASGYVR